MTNLVVSSFFVFICSVFPLWSGGWGDLPEAAAWRWTGILAIGSIGVVVGNRWCFIASGETWDEWASRSKVVTLIAAVAGISFYAWDNFMPIKIALGIWGELAVLFLLRPYRQSLAPLWLGILVGTILACRGIHHIEGVLAVVLLLIPVCYLMANDPADRESRGEPYERRVFLSYASMIGAIAIGLAFVAGAIVGIFEGPSQVETINSVHESSGSSEPRTLIDFVFGLLKPIFFMVLIAIGAKLILDKLSSERGAGQGELSVAEYAKGKVIPILQNKKLSKDTPREKVIFYYNKMLKRLVQHGFAYEAAHTPNGIKKQLAEKVSEQQHGHERVNTLFYRACYSDESIEQEEAQSMEIEAELVLEDYLENLKQSSSEE